MPIDTKPTREMIAERIDDVNAISNEAIVNLYEFINATKSALNTIAGSIPYISDPYENIVESFETTIDADLPEDRTIEMDNAIARLGEFETTVEILPITVDPITVPPFTATPPQITLPQAPGALTASPPQSPQLDTIIPPTPVDLTGKIPTIPKLEDVTIPAPYEPKDFNFEPIDVDINLDLTPPSLVFDYTETADDYESAVRSSVASKIMNALNGAPSSATFAYIAAKIKSELENPGSDLQTALAANLLDTVTNGGVGYGATVQDEIWNLRAERDAIVEFEQTETAIEVWSSRGISLPDNTLLGSIDEIAEKRANDRLDRSRDIAYKEAELAQTNTHFGIEKGIAFEQMLLQFLSSTLGSGVSLEQSLMQYMDGIIGKGIAYEQMMLQHHSNIAERALRAAIATVEMGKAAYEMLIAYYNSQFAKYQLGLQVYEGKLRGELLRLEGKKAEIEGAKLSVDLQNQVLARTKLEIDLVNLYIEIYKKETEMTRLEADLQKNIIDIFRAETEGFIGLVNAKNSEYGLFKAQNDGEISKIQIFGEQVKAYNAQIDGVKAQASIAETKVNAEAAANKGRIEKIQAEIAAFNANVAVVIEKIKAMGDMYKTEGAMYSASIQKGEAETRLQIEATRIAEAANSANLQMKVQVAVQNLNAFIKMAEIQLGTDQDAAKIFAALVSAALQAINASMGMTTGYSEGHSNSVGYDFTGKYADSGSSAPSPKGSTP